MIQKILRICGFALFSLPLMAASPSVQLDDKAVSRYVQSLDQMLPLLQAVDRSGQAWIEGLPEGVPGALYVGQVERGSDLFQQMNQRVQEHGFANVDQWARIGDRILLTRLYIQEQEELDQLYEHMDELEQSLLNNTRQYSTAELEQIMRTFQDSKNHILMLVSTRGDVPWVQPHLAELNAALSSFE